MVKSMSENLPAIPNPNEYDDFTVPVKPVIYQLRLSDGEVIDCDLQNTTLFFFKGVLEIMDHIYHVRESGQPLYLFKSTRAMKEMKSLDFDRFTSSCPPSTFDLSLFFQYAKGKISSGAIKYLEDK